MAATFCRRLHLPAFTEALTCLCRKGRWFSVSSNFQSNENYKINPTFHNRNPRNLERMGLTPRLKGWRFQYPVRDFYNKLDIEISLGHFKATVTHCSGKKIMSLSSEDDVVKQHFDRPESLQMYEIYGRLLAQRMIDSGITQVFYDPSEHGSQMTDQSTGKGFEDVLEDLEDRGEELELEQLEVEEILDPRLQPQHNKLMEILTEAGIEFVEPEYQKPKYKPGIDYDKPNRYAERKKWKNDFQVA